MIGFVICGPEHSGTTLVSDLFRQVPGIDAGFEIGVLLAETPRAFPSLLVHAEITCWSWAIDQPTLAACCDTSDLATFYTRLMRASPLLKPGTHTVFDKTPRYLAHLPACMAKLPVPFIVVFKDPRATVYSDWRKAGSPAFDSWFDLYAPGKLGYLRGLYANYRQVQQSQDPRVCLIRLEDLCLNTRSTCERLYAHVGCAFDPAYMLLRNTRYENTRLGAISAGVPFEYHLHFNTHAQNRIATAFAELDHWFYA